MLRRLSAVLFCAGVLGLESKAASLVFYPAQAGVSTALSGVAYNPDMDRFVAVGTNLVTLMSPESSSLRPSSIWSENLVSTNGPLFRGLSPSALSRVGLRSVVYGNGVFVAGGRNGIFVSSNGVDWANQTVFPKLDVTSVALTRSPGTNVTWVATSRSFPIYYNSHPSSSTNFASAWDSAQVKNGLFERWRAVCALDGSNMAVCGVGGTIRTSSNSGRTWKTIKGRLFGSGPNLNAIAWGDDKLVAVGDREQILLSTNRGANWSIVEKAKGKGTPKLNAVAYSKGGFFAVGDRGLIRFSPDGRNWSTPPVFPAVTDNLTGVALNTDGSVAVIVTGNQTILMGSERPTAVVSLVGTNKPCNGDTNTIQAVLTGNGPWSGNWSDGVPFTSSTDILTRLVTFTNTMAIGSTTVTYTVTNLVDSKELSGTNLTGSAVITVNSTVRANAGTNKNICAEEMAALGGSPTASGGTGPYTYSWSPANYLDNSTNANPVATPPPGSSTIYTVTVTDSLGCSASSNVTVVVSPTLTANAGNNTNICPGKMATLGGSPTASGGAGGYTYSWSPANYLDDATSANPVAAPPANSTITYTVTVTDASNCMASSTVTVRVFLELTATAGMPANVCAGSKVMLGGSPTASGGTGFYTYSWSPTNYLDNPTSANPVLSNAPPGFTTNYTVTVIDASNCTATASITVRVSTLGANAGISRINCSDTNLLILGGLGGTTTASGGTSPYTYSWSPTAFFVDVNDARNANPRVNLPPGTSMTYSLTVTDSNNCVVTSSVTVGVAAPLMADAGPANRVVCLGPVGLGGSPTASGGVPTYTYSWSPTNYLDNPTIANPTFNPPSQGDYTFTVTVTDTNGCMATATTELSVSKLPTIEIVGSTNIFLCAGSSQMLSTTGETGNPGNGAPRYSWSPTNYLDNPTSANPVLSNAPAGFTTNYTVTVMDASNCMAMASVTVRVSTLGANAGASVTIPVAASTNLGGMPTASGGTGPYTYSWLPITYLDDPTSTNPVATPLTDTTYTVTVTDSIGCTATSSITVNVVIGPFAAASLAGPQLHIRVLDASRVLLSWDGEYHLQMATNLSDSGASMAWANVHTNVVAGVNQVTNTVAGRGAFFRLRSP